MQKHLWKDYFHFSRKERAALFVLLVTILLLIFLPRFFTPQVAEPQLDLVAMDSLNTKIVPRLETANAEINNTLPSTAIHLFPFNPNTITEAGLQQLGLRPKTILTLIHYREKGGQFRKPDDLRKIYGLRPEEANRLIPYVSIPSKELAATSLKSATVSLQPTIPVTSATNFQSSAPAASYTSFRKLSPGKQLIATNINTATAADWKKFPGIGEVLSKRIVAFRNKLGGFQSVSQVQQTYGLPDSVFNLMLPYLYLDTAVVASPAVKTAKEQAATSAFRRKPAQLSITLTARHTSAALQTSSVTERNTAAPLQNSPATARYTPAILQTGPTRYTPALLRTSAAATQYTPVVLDTKYVSPGSPARNLLRHKLAWCPLLPIDASPL